MKIFTIHNMICKLGENSIENWNLLKQSGGNDIFFHLSSFPSGYAILECGDDKKVSEEILLYVANICKNGTKYRKLRDVKVDYCLCNNVIRGENTGEVIFVSRRKVKQIKI